MKSMFSSASAFFQAVDAAAIARKDVVADTRSISMKDGLLHVESVHGAVRPTKHMSSQMASALEIPSKLYNQLREGEPGWSADQKGAMLAVLDNLVTTKLQQFPAARMVRMYQAAERDDKNTGRAFVSNKFLRMDFREILEFFVQAMQQHADRNKLEVTVDASGFTDGYGYLSVMFPKMEGEVAKGDVIQMGARLRTSDIGLAPISIEPLYKRLICLNGMTRIDAQDGHSIRHVTGREMHRGVLPSVTTTNLQARTMISHLQDALSLATNVRTFNARLEFMREAAQVKLDGPIAQTLELVAEEVGVSSKAHDHVMNAFLTGKIEPSKWAVANAFTRAAQDVDDYDDSMAMEAAGGRILAMNTKKWSTIGQQAESLASAEQAARNRGSRRGSRRPQGWANAA